MPAHVDDVELIASLGPTPDDDVAQLLVPRPVFVICAECRSLSYLVMCQEVRTQKLAKWSRNSSNHSLINYKNIPKSHDV